MRCVHLSEQHVSRLNSFALNGKNVISKIIITVPIALVLSSALYYERASAQSFNCRSAKTADEILICQDNQLSQLDKRTATLYSQVRSRLSISQRPLVEAEQRTWLRSRMKCGSDKGCITQAYEKRLRELSGPTTAAPTPLPDVTSADQASILMEKEGGVYVVPVRFNDMITLNAIVDSGASDMSIPADIVSTLIRTKTIADQDFLGQQTYVLADGSKVPSQRFRIRSLKVGNKTVENVVASIASVNGEILLGQSFLNRFKSWSVDNEQHTLTLR